MKIPFSKNQYRRVMSRMKIKESNEIDISKFYHFRYIDEYESQYLLRIRVFFRNLHNVWITIFALFRIVPVSIKMLYLLSFYYIKIQIHRDKYIKNAEIEFSKRVVQ